MTFQNDSLLFLYKNMTHVIDHVLLRFSFDFKGTKFCIYSEILYHSKHLIYVIHVLFTTNNQESEISIVIKNII